MSKRNAGISLGAVAIVAIAAVVLLGGGSDATDSTSDTESAFVAEMVPHHKSAIEMAQIAQTRAEHPEIKQLANNIIATQSSEIDKMNAINERLYGGPVGETDHGSLGLSADSMGMSMDTSSLETAQPFDRAFIDMMIPHHQGAITMARIELADGNDAETRALANDIIDAQSSEIKQMNDWRTKWYGSPSPAGGVPDPSAASTATSSSDPMTGMSH